jgi:V/A-type H+-transporting ATPase subunit C
MSGYDYGNARLRAMKSRLLSRPETEALAQVGSVQALINALIKTAYRKAVETALVRASGLACVAEALSRDLVDTLGKVRRFYSGRTGEMVVIPLRAFDVHNLKTILRGLSKHATPDEIAAALLPVGELTPALLTRLARAPEPRAAIYLLASMRLPMAQPLLTLRAGQPGAGVFEMELALDRWHFQQAYSYVQKSPHATGLLRSALDLEADLVNLLTALRFAHAPAERQVLRKRLGGDDLDRLFVGPGRLSFESLVRAGGQDSLESAVEALAGTPYQPPLRAGLEVYATSGRLSDLEKELRRFRLRWMARLIIKDPLGVGVPLGYCALKTSEVTNIRWVAQGISMGLEADAIRAELEFAT